MSEKLLIDAEIAPAHVADEAVGIELFVDEWERSEERVNKKQIF